MHCIHFHIQCQGETVVAWGRWWLLRYPKPWVAVGQLMSVHCIAAAPFPCISVASQRFLQSIMVVKLTRGDRIKRCHANGWWVARCSVASRERPSSDARDIQKSRHHSESNSRNVSTYHVGYCAMWGDVKLLGWEREKHTNVQTIQMFNNLFVYSVGTKKNCDA